ncbi:MAG: hypothetical protein F6J93_38625 [Oscillatoria sp. SIO1A7]|nr:hypothetical protein [Oscillatoria sp. SIO1A7]
MKHCWLLMRSWIECLFKGLKRGGFGSHHTKMTNPEHAERLWLAIAVATLWYVSIGGGVDRNLSANSLSTQSQSNSNSTNLSDHTPTNKTLSALTIDISAISENYCGDDDSSPVSRSAYFSPDPCADSKWLSCFRRGFLRLLAALIKQDPLPRGEALFLTTL